jgi:hypothetical protein
MKVNVLPVGALESLCLIQNQVLPLDTIKILEVCNNKLVTCDHNMKTCFPRVQVFLVPKLAQYLAFLLVKMRIMNKSVGKCKSHTSSKQDLNLDKTVVTKNSCKCCSQTFLGLFHC